jgi:hypothetical protein
MSDLYEADILEWSEKQTALLRRIAAGEPVNQAPDWQNIIEEIEDVGGSALRSVRSLFFQAFLHDLKAQAWPSSTHVEHWRGEARGFRVQALDEVTPAMKQRIDIAKVYARALRAMPDTIDGQAPLPVPTVCPVTLDELLGEGT